MRTRVRVPVPVPVSASALPFALAVLLVVGLLPQLLRAAPMQRHVTTCSGSAAMMGSLPYVLANDVQSGDTVVFDQDCSDTTNTPVTLAAPLVLPAAKNVIIDALIGTQRTIIIDGNNATQIMRIQAINNAGPTVTLNGLTLRKGSVSGQGGAIFNDQGTLTITNSAFLNNTANIGGGALANAGGTVTITNSTFSGNKVMGTTQATGGAIENNASGRLTITSSTIAGNIVTSTAMQSGSGGGIFDFQGAANTVKLTATIVAGNTGGNCNGADIGTTNPNGFQSGGNNLIGVRHNAPADTTCGVDFTGITGGGDQVGTDAAPINARFGPIGLYTGKTPVLPLLPGSPAINAAGASCPSGVVSDQRGVARPAGGACDIGAFESQGFTVAISSGSAQTTPVSMAFMNPLTVNVAAVAGGEPVNGGVITFTPMPAMSGATATLAGSPATIGSGAASVTATANATGGVYTVQASASGVTTTATFTLTNLTPLAITQTTLPNGAVGRMYSQTLTATGGVGPYTYAVTGGMLPPGLMLNTMSGAISGTPTQAGGSMFTVTVTDSGMRTAPQVFTLTIDPGVTQISPASGDYRGGALVTIAGDGFVAGSTTVTFGGAAATVQSVTATTITLRTPPSPTMQPAVVDVVVAVSGKPPFTVTNGYMYGIVNAAPNPLRATATPLITPAPTPPLPTPPPTPQGLPTPRPSAGAGGGATPVPQPPRRTG